MVKSILGGHKSVRQYLKSAAETGLHNETFTNWILPEMASDFDSKYFFLTFLYKAYSTANDKPDLYKKHKTVEFIQNTLIPRLEPNNSGREALKAKVSTFVSLSRPDSIVMAMTLVSALSCHDFILKWCETISEICASDDMKQFRFGMFVQTLKNRLVQVRVFRLRCLKIVSVLTSMFLAQNTILRPSSKVLRSFLRSGTARARRSEKENGTSSQQRNRVQVERGKRQGAKHDLRTQHTRQFPSRTRTEEQANGTTPCCQFPGP